MSFAHFALKHLTPKMLMTLGVPIVTVAAVAGIAVGSNAAFVSSTNTDTNNWATGVVQLTSDHVGSAAFTPATIVPGYTETHCIVVSSSSTVPTEVKLFASSASPAPLSYDLQFNIQTGTGGTDVPGVNGAPGSCSGFTPDAVDSTIYSGTANDFMTNHTNALTGVGAVELAPGATKTYLITATLPDSSNRQGATTSTAFSWIATNK